MCLLQTWPLDGVLDDMVRSEPTLECWVHTDGLFPEFIDPELFPV